MNKHIENAFSNYNFTFDKLSGYGHIDGYEVNAFISPTQTQSGLQITFSTFLTQAQKNEFVVMLNQRKMQLVQAGAFDFGVAVSVTAWTNKGFEKKIPEVVSAMLSILDVLGAPKADVCPQSGEVLDEMECKVITLPDSPVKVRLSNMAIATVNSAIDKSNEDFKNAPNNYLKGFVGIAIGAVVGVIVAFVCSMLGYVTSFAPLVSIFLGVFLYKKFGGKPNFVMLIMSFVTTIVAILGTLLALYVIIAEGAVAEIGLTLAGFEALTYCFENAPEFKDMFVEEMVYNVLFILVAEGISVVRLLKMIKRPQNVK